MEEVLNRWCVLKPGRRPQLDSWDTVLPNGVLGSKEEGLERLEVLGRQIAELQRCLWAERKHKILLILQGMDTSGKDGTIRHVFHYTNPSGVNVAAFSRPTERELSYDYLWRVHQRVPHAGEIVIFDRSHYEDLTTVRVHRLVEESVWCKRFDHVNAFEQMLVDEGTTVLKIFLHISRAEQKNRLRARLKDSRKYWKFHESDLSARECWPEYMTAYDEALERCNTSSAPWYIIPADKKWQRNLLVAALLRRALVSLEMRFPDAHFDPASVEI